MFLLQPCQFFPSPYFHSIQHDPFHHRVTIIVLKYPLNFLSRKQHTCFIAVIVLFFLIWTLWPCLLLQFLIPRYFHSFCASRVLSLRSYFTFPFPPFLNVVILVFSAYNNNFFLPRYSLNRQITNCKFMFDLKVAK